MLDLDPDMFEMALKRALNNFPFLKGKLSSAQISLIGEMVWFIRRQIKVLFVEMEQKNSSRIITKEDVKNAIRQAEELLARKYCGEGNTSSQMFNLAVSVRRHYSAFVGVETKKNNKKVKK